MDDSLISRQDAIDALKVAYWDRDIQSAKDDPCIVDAMTDWAIRQIKGLPSVGKEDENIRKAKRMKWQYEGSTTKELRHLLRVKTVEMKTYRCPYCKGTVTTERNDIPPLHCPSCGANMRGEYHG